MIMNVAHKLWIAMLTHLVQKTIANSFFLVFTSDTRETNTGEDEDNESDVSDQSDDEYSDVWCKTDKKKPSDKPSLRIAGLNISVDSPERIDKVVSAITDADLIQIFSEQSNLYHTQHAQQWKV
jgi:hypothetical protein